MHVIEDFGKCVLKVGVFFSMIIMFSCLMPRRRAVCGRREDEEEKESRFYNDDNVRMRENRE